MNANGPQVNPRTGLRGANAAKRPLGLLVAAGIEAWTSSYAAVTSPTTFKSFRNLFASFGGELSGSTRLLLAMPYVWFPFAFVGVGLLVWIGVNAQPNDIERRRMKRALWIFGLAFGLSVAWAATALYLPLFRLGAVV